MRYLRRLVYPVAFYSLIYFLSFSQNGSSIFYDKWFLLFVIANIITYPFARLFIESLNKKFVSLPHWNRSVGFICLVLAFPISILYFIKK